MKLKLSTLLICCMMALPVQAKNKVSLHKALIEMNRIKPLQNPRYETADEVLNRNILDSTKKVAGEVKDVILNQRDGKINSIVADFNRLNLNQDVFLNYESLDIKSFSKGYGLGYRNDVIEEIYPSLLSGTETAGQGDHISLSSIIDRRVVTSDGKNIGRVENVLFNRNATKAVGLYVSVTAGAIFEEGIVIPFILGKNITKPSGPETQIHPKVAAHMIKYLKDR